MVNHQNPYANTILIDPGTPTGECLPFDGRMEREDYVRLRPTHRSEGVLLRILLGIMSTIAVLVFIIFLGALLSSPGIVPMAVISLFFAGVLFVLWLLQYMIHRREDVDRFLSQNSDLLGVARGEFSDGGLYFFDDVHHHWFGPATLTQVWIGQAGIRVPVDGDPNRYLALTSRLFPSYSPDTARRLQQVWQRSVRSQPAASTAVPAIWASIYAPPSDAIPFVLTRSPVPVSLRFKLQWILQALITLVGPVCLLLFFRHPIANWLALAYVAYWFIHASMNIRAWIQFLFSNHVAIPAVEGWISSEDVATQAFASGMRTHLHSLNVSNEDGRWILGTQRSALLILERAQFSSDNDWQQVCDRLRERTHATNV